MYINAISREDQPHVAYLDYHLSIDALVPAEQALSHISSYQLRQECAARVGMAFDRRYVNLVIQHLEQHELSTASFYATKIFSHPLKRAWMDHIIFLYDQSYTEKIERLLREQRIVDAAAVVNKIQDPLLHQSCAERVELAWKSYYTQDYESQFTHQVEYWISQSHEEPSCLEIYLSIAEEYAQRINTAQLKEACLGKIQEARDHHYGIQVDTYLANATTNLSAPNSHNAYHAISAAKQIHSPKLRALHLKKAHDAYDRYCQAIIAKHLREQNITAAQNRLIPIHSLEIKQECEKRLKNAQKPSRKGKSFKEEKH